MTCLLYTSCCILPAFHDKQVVFQVVVDGTDTCFFDNALLVIIPLCFHLLYSVCCLYGIIDIGCQIPVSYTQLFHCFGCQADGDVIDFTARLFGLNKKAAALTLAERCV